MESAGIEPVMLPDGGVPMEPVMEPLMVELEEEVLLLSPPPLLPPPPLVEASM